MNDQLMLLENLEVQPDQPELYYKSVSLSPDNLEWLAEQQDRVTEAVGKTHGVVVEVLEDVQARLGLAVMEEWSQRCFGWDADMVRAIREGLSAVRAQEKELRLKRDEVILQRRLEGATQQQIADELGMGRQTVSDIEKATLLPTDSNAVAPPKTDCRVKLSSEDRKVILTRMAAGDLHKDIANDFGVHVNTIRNIKKTEVKKQTKALISTPLPTAPSAGNDVSSNGKLVTPPVALFSEEGHDLQKQAAYYHKRFVQELKHCFTAIDNATRRLDKIHNAVLDDLQENHRSMYLRWTVYEELWSREMQLDLDCMTFSEIERRLDAKAKLLSKKVKHAFSDLQYDRSKITIAK